MKHIINQKFFKLSEFRRTLVLPLDSSKYSQYTIQWSKANLFDIRDKIVLVNIRPLNTSVNIAETVKSKLLGETSVSITETVKNKISGEDFDVDDPGHNIDCEQEQIMMDGYAKQLENYNVEYYIGLGHVKRDLVDFVDGFKADLVVIGHRGDSMMKLMWGSIGNYMVHNSKASVLVVKKPE
ncbi:hypothetical protein HDV01_000884 [Terramyces sp. JEL0728]|nr:hypothetical protein HDV01_000884 [Terramyces sp. JEL0728]